MMTKTKSEVVFLDLRETYLEIKEELDGAARRVMDSGWYILGREVQAFEEAFAAFCGVSHCVGVGNGLEALQLILRANIYIATWLAVSGAGATVVPVEPVERTFNLDPARISAAITKRTKAI